MLNYFLGYITAYLEITGRTWSGLAAAATGVIIFMLRSWASELTKPVIQETIADVRKTDVRLDKIARYLTHHLAGHPGSDPQTCVACGIK